MSETCLQPVALIDRKFIWLDSSSDRRHCFRRYLLLLLVVMTIVSCSSFSRCHCTDMFHCSSSSLSKLSLSLSLLRFSIAFRSTCLHRKSTIISRKMTRSTRILYRLCHGIKSDFFVFSQPFLTVHSSLSLSLLLFPLLPVA
jgi:hypothetical protein